ncbi:MAG TPA: FKBP-type peptidyl-prolyl cis-trans isomerase [Sphingobacteriaceae bacterium]|nr:FKBP-type peptidyl-prolyl cis-trans isomerase [Sphingobacteriaceae bacterium]
MKKSFLVLALASAFLFGACQQNKLKDGPGGLKYQIVKDAGEEKAQAGDMLSISMIIKSDRDSLLTDTYEIGLPQIVNIAPDSIPGLYPGDHNTMFSMLGEGDSAIFHLDLDTMAAQTGSPKPPFVDSHIIFYVKVNKHFKKGDLTDSAHYEVVNAYFDTQIENLKNAESGKIENYVSSNNLTTESTSSGLQIVFEEKGTGVTPTATDTVLVNYTGRLTNGKVFDSSIEEEAMKANIHNPMRTYEPAKFVIGVGQVIPGWEEGLALAPKGSKFKLIIPSVHAYGEQGDMRGQIPPYSPLVFDIELIDVIPATNGN